MRHEDDETDLETGFASIMQEAGDVKTLKREARANESIQKRALNLDAAKREQRLSALGESASADTLHALAPEKYDANDIMGFKQPGLQDGVYKKLRTGKYGVDAKLDLHGLSLDQGLNATLRFVNQSVEGNKRCVLISHGKGIKQNQPARMKNHLAAWLKQIPGVLAYHSALPNQGGAGSVYVLLKKSMQSKQENRERFNQRTAK